MLQDLTITIKLSKKMRASTERSQLISDSKQKVLLVFVPRVSRTLAQSGRTFLDLKKLFFSRTITINGRGARHFFLKKVRPDRFLLIKIVS